MIFCKKQRSGRTMLLYISKIDYNIGFQEKRLFIFVVVLQLLFIIL
jgi:hypothetical protein